MGRASTAFAIYDDFWKNLKILIENATQEDIDALVQALSVYNASIMKMSALW